MDSLGLVTVLDLAALRSVVESVGPGVGPDLLWLHLLLGEVDLLPA